MLIVKFYSSRIVILINDDLIFQMPILHQKMILSIKNIFIKLMHFHAILKMGKVKYKDKLSRKIDTNCNYILSN
jgi:hypothetical protein